MSELLEFINKFKYYFKNMFLIYSIEDKILLKPEELNKQTDNTEISYEDVVLNRSKEKYLGKVLLNHGIVISIKKFVLRNNLIVEMEGIINVEVSKNNYKVISNSMTWS